MIEYYLTIDEYELFYKYFDEMYDKHKNSDYEEVTIEFGFFPKLVLITAVVVVILIHINK
jgi:hypothetical protein